MALGPMEIHQKEFNTVRMGGYNKEEVDAFLDQVADEMDRLLHRGQELMGMVESMRAKVSEYDGMQQTLQNALINAQRSADSTLQEAQAQANAMLEEARSQADSLLEEANMSKQAAIQEAGAEKDRINADIQQLHGAANEYMAAVRGMLDSTSHTLDEYETRLNAARENARLAAAPVAEAAGVREAEMTSTPVPLAEEEPIPAFVEQAEPALEEPLYVPPEPEPAYQEPIPEAAPAYQEPIPEPAYQEPIPEAAPAYQEPAYQEPIPEPAYQEPIPEPAYQEPIPEAAPAEPQAFVPKMEPMEEVPEEDSPIRPIEPGTYTEAGSVEPQAFVPTIHLEDAGEPAAAISRQAPPFQEPEEATRSTLENLAGSGSAAFVPEVSPVSPDDIEEQYAPPPEKEDREDKGEKHFFWE